ncbi:MAG: type II toxin-antitoxin system RelE/ParE family toxin [Gemmataceae bacterium]
MAANLLLTAEAQTDLDEAYDWYERRRIGLGEDFYDCVEAALESIRRMPLMYAKVFHEARRLILRRFPYAIFYEPVSDDMIFVYCVFHTARDSAEWQRRIP